MIETRFYGRLKTAIEQQIEAYKDGLAAGTPKDMAEYREHVGYIRAMREVLDVAKGINKEISGDQD